MLWLWFYALSKTFCKMSKMVRNLSTGQEKCQECQGTFFQIFGGNPTMLYSSLYHIRLKVSLSMIKCSCVFHNKKKYITYEYYKAQSDCIYFPVSKQQVSPARHGRLHQWLPPPQNLKSDPRQRLHHARPLSCRMPPLQRQLQVYQSSQAVVGWKVSCKPWCPRGRLAEYLTSTYIA